jgi:phosphatidylserine/phosphatidylglycerophosphate/cardiolipin synthase-like enzyme
VDTTIELKVVANSDDTYLVWRPTNRIENCLGFAIKRKRNGGEPELLKNRVGFSSDQQENFSPQPSTTLPFQRLDWTDHGGNTGDRLSYQVVAMVGQPGHLQEGPASAWSDDITLSADCGDGLSAYFNRGIVLSQFVARLMRERNWKIADLRTHAATLNDPLRDFLGGDLRKALLQMVDAVAADASKEIYAALFELTDDELVGKLMMLGPRLHIVLANGAVKHAGDDENTTARDKLRQAGAEVIDRMSAPHFLAHNKFAVVCDKARGGQQPVPFSVWTGSANWQPTGLCTQVNNGIMIGDAGVAADFFSAWNRLKDAESASTPDLKQVNSAEPVARQLANSQVRVSSRFTATRDQVDMDDLLGIIGEAKTSVLFQMFMPGQDIFDAVNAKTGQMFVRGVVNTFPGEGSTHATTQLVGGTAHGKTVEQDVVEPSGIGHSIGSWMVDEITRKGFNQIGHAIIHSKVLVVDATGDNPIVVTGSHNFSKTASAKNDENFVVIRGSKALAMAYAVNCIAVYEHYRWRAYVNQAAGQQRQPWSHLAADGNWLDNYIESPARRQMLNFWLPRSARR